MKAYAMDRAAIDREWEGMPEFTQERQRPFSTLIVRLETEADLRAFAELIGQKLTPKTKSIWFPEKEHRQRGLWIDES